ncbi:hypothetical protein J1614_003982 [Plenodomus biglobosus]|nr:hypothetical protein J1614_003982 [Plenodomus biglobosus]
MAEVVGLVASVIQVAGAGLKLSQTLYQYADGVATADRRIRDIAKDVKLTSLVIDELGNVFKQDETARLISRSAVTTAEETMKECSTVFSEIDTMLAKSRKGTMGRLMLPFRDNKIELLRSHIDKLKSTLQLLMQVLVHAFQVTSNKLDREAEARQRDELKELLELQRKATKRYEDSLRSYSISDGSTLVGDDEKGDQSMDDVFSTNTGTVTVSAIASTITPETLANCMQHVQSLLKNIQSLQQALEHKVEGEDHSDHHQNLFGSYLQTRGHLDKVLLGNNSSTTPPRSAAGPQPQTHSTAFTTQSLRPASSLKASSPASSAAPKPVEITVHPTVETYDSFDPWEEVVVEKQEPSYFQNIRSTFSKCTTTTQSRAEIVHEHSIDTALPPVPACPGGGGGGGGHPTGTSIHTSPRRASPAIPYNVESRRVTAASDGDYECKSVPVCLPGEEYGESVMPPGFIPEARVVGHVSRGAGVSVERHEARMDDDVDELLQRWTILGE